MEYNLAFNTFNVENIFPYTHYKKDYHICSLTSVLTHKALLGNHSTICKRESTKWGDKQCRTYARGRAQVWLIKCKVGIVVQRVVINITIVATIVTLPSTLPQFPCWLLDNLSFMMSIRSTHHFSFTPSRDSQRSTLAMGNLALALGQGRISSCFFLFL